MALEISVRRITDYRCIMDPMKVFKGGCHCQAVRFEVQAPDEVTVWVCNCSVCQMRKNYHFIVPKQQMKAITG